MAKSNFKVSRQGRKRARRNPKPKARRFKRGGRRAGLRKRMRRGLPRFKRGRAKPIVGKPKGRKPRRGVIGRPVGRPVPVGKPVRRMPQPLPRRGGTRITPIGRGMPSQNSTRGIKPGLTKVMGFRKSRR